MKSYKHTHNLNTAFRFSGFILFLVLLLFNSSCSTDNQFSTSDPTEPQEVSNFESNDIKYFVDEKMLQYSDYESSKGNDGRLVVIGKSDNSTELHYFNLIEDYIEFGEGRGMNLRKQVRFENEVHSYMEQTNAEEYFERYGKYPESLEKYAEEAYDKIFGKQVSRAPIMIGDACGNGASQWPIGMVQAVMPPGWNDRMSSYYSFNFIQTMAIYDRSWYRFHLATTNIEAGYTWVCLATAPGLEFTDNRTSSVISN